MLPSSPPKYASWAALVKSFDSKTANGWQTFAVQCVVGTTRDGAFGPLTVAALKKWQAAHGLTADAICGPATQGKMLQVVSAAVDTHYSVIPDGLLLGFARVEGVNLLAATNWQVSGGVDCGPVQERVYGPPYALDKLEEAFNPQTAFTYAARSFTSRVSSYKKSNPTGLSTRRIIEAAVLAHNWPAGAAQIMKYGHVLNGSEPATWTFNAAAGRPYTREEWSVEYPSRVLTGVDY